MITDYNCIHVIHNQYILWILRAYFKNTHIIKWYEEVYSLNCWFDYKDLLFLTKYTETKEWTGKWVGAILWGTNFRRRPESGVQAFITDKPKKDHFVSKYTFIALNLAFYCTLSASMLFQLFINFWPKKITTSPLIPRSYVPWYRWFYDYCKKSLSIPKGNQKP